MATAVRIIDFGQKCGRAQQARCSSFGRCINVAASKAAATQFQQPEPEVATISSEPTNLLLGINSKLKLELKRGSVCPRRCPPIRCAWLARPKAGHFVI